MPAYPCSGRKHQVQAREGGEGERGEARQMGSSLSLECLPLLIEQICAGSNHDELPVRYSLSF